jgi:hypothetical protein
MTFLNPFHTSGARHRAPIALSRLIGSTVLGVKGSRFRWFSSSIVRWLADPRVLQGGSA